MRGGWAIRIIEELLRKSIENKITKPLYENIALYVIVFCRMTDIPTTE